MAHRHQPASRSEAGSKTSGVTWLMLLWLSVCGTLTACHSLPPLSAAASSDRNVQATQWMQLRSGNQLFEAICLLEITSTTMKLAATTPQGQTLMTAELAPDGTLTTTLVPWLDANGLKAEQIARDVQIALWPALTLIEAGWQIEEKNAGNQRLVRLHGEPWANIVYEGGQQKPSRIVIERGQNLYTVELRTLEWITP